MKEIKKASPSDAGCWIDGHWGQYGMGECVSIARSYGYVDAELDEWQLDGSQMADYEYIGDACDAAESWLNQNVAPEGYAFGWHDGEFFLWSDEEWDDES